MDAWDIWSPYIEQAMGLDNARILVNGNGYGATTRSRWLRAPRCRPSQGRRDPRLPEPSTRRYVWSGTHFSTWANVWGEATGLPGSIMLTAAKDAATKAVPITSGVISAEQQLVNAFDRPG